MKALILGAGYGTRLQRDLVADKSSKYSSLVGVPKPLLPIGQRSLISQWMVLLKDISQIDKIYVVVSISRRFN